MDNLPINGVDIAVGLVLLISSFLAYARGFVHEMLTVAGWLGAIFATIYGLPFAKPYARDLISNDIAADVGAGVVLFIVTLVVLSFITKAISARIRDSAMNLLDRSLGFIFGLLRGAFLICLVYLVVEWMMPAEEQPQWLRQAQSITIIEQGTGLLRGLIPEDMGFGGNGGFWSPEGDGPAKPSGSIDEMRTMLEKRAYLGETMPAEWTPQV